MAVLDIEDFLSDLSVFADIGTSSPTIESDRNEHIINFVRLGEPTELFVASSGAMRETYGDSEVRHASVKALFASERYGSLRDWAAKQHAYLSQELEPAADRIEVKGIVDGEQNPRGLDQIDDLLAAPQKEGSAKVLLIDGPAGIGKTYFILELAARRAESYSKSRRPLILHVQSRGRTLSYIFDLIAFSLQRLRIDVTFDQVPVLAKYGLITIAIDGFDELADPDGYDLAWGQVSDLVEGLRGAGSIILAGRETFIGRDRVIKDIASLRQDKDDIAVVTLQAPQKGEALRWLARKGWSEPQLSAVENFLEPSSLALRPFFLATLSNPSVAEQMATTESTNILSILMEAMIEREIGKFGDQVESSLSVVVRKKYIRDLMGEAAREIAEGSSASISDPTLYFLADVVLPEKAPETVRKILKARSQSVAFLTNDERRGHRRFFHDKFFEYFLSTIMIEFVSKGQSSKFISRGLCGSSFLETFGTIIAGGVSTKEATAFLKGALTMMDRAAPADRTRKNIASMILAALPVADVLENFQIDGIEVEEARITGTSAPCKIANSIISQLDCRGADLSALVFESTTILTLIADPQTALPDVFPVPSRIQDVSARAISDPVQIQDWLNNHRLAPVSSDRVLPGDLRAHPAIRLLQKACRIRQYWLRRSDDVYAARILEDENWPLIEVILDKHDLLRVEYRQASGTDARFVHVRKGPEILAESPDNSEIVAFYKDLVHAIRLQ